MMGPGSPDAGAIEAHLGPLVSARRQTGILVPRQF
jgi:hypothetical protein